MSFSCEQYLMLNKKYDLKVNLQVKTGSKN